MYAFDEIVIDFKLFWSLNQDKRNTLIIAKFFTRNKNSGTFRLHMYQKTSSAMNMLKVVSEILLLSMISFLIETKFFGSIMKACESEKAMTERMQKQYRQAECWRSGDLLRMPDCLNATKLALRLHLLE